VQFGNYDDDDDDDDDGSQNSTATTMSQQEKHIQSKLADIIRPYHKEQKPVVVRNAVRSAPATTLWSLEYWQEVIGRETDEINVSVEMGSSYGSAESERAEIPFSAYLHFLQLFEERHGQTGSLDNIYYDCNGGGSSYSTALSPIIPTNELVYMAQNDLLPSLYKDVIIPDFCFDDDKNKDKEKSNTSSTVVGYGRLYSVMMWLGSRGCVSPLHFDPLDNCFMQHQGRKRVLLFPPSSKSESGSSSSSYWHYAGHEGQQYNTSPINPEILDWKEDKLATTIEQNQQQDDSSNSYDNFSSYSKKYPLFFEDAPTRLECFLQPGDLLYIPKRWWHHVRSIDTSASVNVWWR